MGDCFRRPDQPHKLPGCRVVALSLSKYLALVDVLVLNMSVFDVVYAGALHVGDEIVEICGISVQGRTVDFLQKMLVSISLILWDDVCHLFSHRR